MSVEANIHAISVHLSASQSHAAYHDLPRNIRLSVSSGEHLFFSFGSFVRHSLVWREKKPKIGSLIRLMPWHRFATIQQSWKNWSKTVNHCALNKRGFFSFFAHSDDRLWCSLLKFRSNTNLYYRWFSWNRNRNVMF